MGRNGNGTHYASLNRSDVPQGRKRKTSEGGSGYFGRPFKAERQAGDQDSAQQSEWREDAESSVCLESRNAREEYPRGNVERREYVYVLERRPTQKYGSHRVAGSERTSGYLGVILGPWAIHLSNSATSFASTARWLIRAIARLCSPCSPEHKDHHHHPDDESPRR